MKNYNWAVLGTGVIANETAAALQKNGRNLFAVGNRTHGKAVAFAEKYNIGKVYDSYDEMFTDPDVDIIYITTPHNTHYGFMKKAILNKKHILVEKSITLNSDELGELISLADENNVVIGEAMTVYHMPIYKKLNEILKSGTSDSRQDWFAVGEYKKLPNEVGGQETVAPEDVENRMRALLNAYNAKTRKTLRDLLDFHVQFESIHPFQDGNGRVGRLIMFKECLRNGITPFIIEDDIKEFYYRGLKEWKNEQGYLMDTCLTAQDRFKVYMDYFGLEYKE